MGTDFAAQLTGKLVVHRMSRFRGDDTSFERASCQSQVTNDVKQFVACRFILPYERFRVEESQLGCVHVGHTQLVCQFVKAFL